MFSLLIKKYKKMQRNNRVNDNKFRGVSQIINEESFKAKDKSVNIIHHYVVPWELIADRDRVLNNNL